MKVEKGVREVEEGDGEAEERAREVKEVDKGGQGCREEGQGG
jgi:hypothetical protein